MVALVAERTLKSAKPDALGQDQEAVAHSLGEQDVLRCGAKVCSVGQRRSRDKECTMPSHRKQSFVLPRFARSTKGKSIQLHDAGKVLLINMFELLHQQAQFVLTRFHRRCRAHWNESDVTSRSQRFQRPQDLRIGPNVYDDLFDRMIEEVEPVLEDHAVVCLQNECEDANLSHVQGRRTTCFRMPRSSRLTTPRRAAPHVPHRSEARNIYVRISCAMPMRETCSERWVSRSDDPSARGAPRVRTGK